MQETIVTKIQRFCLHDGPGIRTTIFFKGCPLRCDWCCNPETQSDRPQLIQNRSLCIRCGICVKVCPLNAITMLKTGSVIDFSACDSCGKCASVCPTHSLELCGQAYAVEPLFNAVLLDKEFFQVSGGGVTASGGEPLSYSSFIRPLFTKLKRLGIHTAVETCGWVSWENFRTVLKVTDLFLYDIKHLDTNKHRDATGKGNRLIIRNLEKLVNEHCAKVILRLPLIPGFNDTDEHLNQISRFAEALGIREMHLLPYHRLGKAKYDGLGKSYTFADIQPISPESILQTVKRIHNDKQIRISIGG